MGSILNTARAIFIHPKYCQKIITISSCQNASTPAMLMYKAVIIAAAIAKAIFVAGPASATSNSSLRGCL